jgi:hypothetical protein
MDNNPRQRKESIYSFARVTFIANGRFGTGMTCRHLVIRKQPHMSSLVSYSNIIQLNIVSSPNTSCLSFCLLHIHQFFTWMGWLWLYVCPSACFFSETTDRILMNCVTQSVKQKLFSGLNLGSNRSNKTHIYYEAEMKLIWINKSVAHRYLHTTRSEHFIYSILFFNMSCVQQEQVTRYFFLFLPDFGNSGLVCCKA